MSDGPSVKHEGLASDPPRWTQYRSFPEHWKAKAAPFLDFQLNLCMMDPFPRLPPAGEHPADRTYRGGIMHHWNCLRLEQKDQVAHLILNRPDKRNTMTISFFRELKEAFERIDADESQRVVLLSGEGKSFTAGLDLVEAASLWQEPSAKSRHAFRQMVLGLQDGITAVERCRKPVLAAIHSHCIGGGVDLICACDIRMASQDAVFSIRESRMAMVADLGTLQRIASIVGQGWARELALTGRDFDAGLAMRIGLLTHVFPDRAQLMEEAFRMAQEISRLSPITVQGVKETLNFSRDHGITAGLEYVAQKNAALLPSEDLMEAFQAFMEKRSPNFRGR